MSELESQYATFYYQDKLFLESLELNASGLMLPSILTPAIQGTKEGQHVDGVSEMEPINTRESDREGQPSLSPSSSPVSSQPAHKPPRAAQTGSITNYSLHQSDSAISVSYMLYLFIVI